MFFWTTGFQKSAAFCCLLLGACSGGGGSIMSGGVAPQPPQPPAAPTTLAAQPPGTAFPLAAHSGIEALNVTTTLLSGFTSGDFAAAPAGQVVKTASGFTLTIPGGDQAIIDTSASSAQRVAAGTYLATVVPGSVFVMFHQGAELTYSTFGTWDERNASARFTSLTAVTLRSAISGGVVAYGLMTQQMPTGGSATFTGTAAGLYTLNSFAGAFTSDSVKLVADFQTGRIAGAVTNLVSPAATPARLSDVYLTAGTITGAGFTGTAVASGNASGSSLDLAGGTGSFTGQFNGPNAAEAGGTFTLTNDAARLRLTGAFAAAGQATAAGQPAPTPPAPPTTLASAQAGTVFTGWPHYGLESLTITDPATGAPTAQFPAAAAVLSATITTAADGFAFTLPDGGTAAFKTAAGAPGPNGATVFSASVTGASRTARFMTGPGLTTAAYGSWDELTAAPSTSGAPGTSRTATIAGGVFAYGVETAKVPVTGSATYTGGVVGHYFLPDDSGALTGGTARLVADFAKPSIAGAVTGLTGQSAVSGGTRFLSDIFFTGAFISGAAFQAQAQGGANVASSDLSTTAGLMNGLFYGPNAAEAAGTFTLSDPGLGIAVAGAFGGTGVVTPAGQPTPSVPAPPTLDPATATLATLPAGVRVGGGGVTTLPVVSTAGGPGGPGPVQTASGLDFQFSGGGGAATLTPADKGAFGYFGAFKDPTGATLGMIHMIENPLTYASYGMWSLSTDTSPAALPGMERTTSRASAFVYGITTQATQMPTTGAATYTGAVLGGFSTDPTGFGVVTSGALNLVADFGRDSVSGTVTNIIALRANAAPGALDRLNDVALRQTFFNSGAPFSGVAAVVPTAGVTLDLGGPQGNYTGQFYGPGAPEVAGTLSVNDGHNSLQLGFAGRK